MAEPNTKNGAVEDQELTSRKRAYARDLARRVLDGTITEETAYTILRDETTKARYTPEAQAEMYGYLTWALDHMHSPADAVQAVYDMTASASGNIPPWCPPLHGRLWYSALILGADGRDFRFACHAFAAVAGLNPKAVLRFRQAATRAGAFREVSPGVRGVCSTVYLLGDRYWTDWGRIIDPGAARQRFPWLFSERNTRGGESFDLWKQDNKTTRQQENENTRI